jgi:hypothetical protein
MGIRREFWCLRDVTVAVTIEIEIIPLAPTEKIGEIIFDWSCNGRSCNPTTVSGASIYGHPFGCNVVIDTPLRWPEGAVCPLDELGDRLDGCIARLI